MRMALSRRKFVETAVAAGVFLPMITRVSAQGWPSKPIRIVVGFPAGGQTDLFARAYGDYLAKQLGQPVIVENKAGAGGSLGAVEVKRAAPDGHTLMVAPVTTVVMNRMLYKEIGYNTEQDFTLVSMLPSSGLVMVTSSKTGASNLKEFVDYARKADKVNVGNYAPGSLAHIVITEMNKQFGLKLEPVHYRGEAPMWTDLAGQTLDAAIGSYSASLSVVQSGRGKPIAVTSSARMSKLPDIGTFAEQGATSKAYRLTLFLSATAPAGTPPSIVQKLSDLIVTGTQSEKVQELLKTYSVDGPVLGREAAQKLYDEEAPVWLNLAQSLGLTPQ